ncbi:DUF2703 domain-containing protein [Candidatus Roizmanbacteria bacterium]|nr:DUF2703 domain-containing protein [Candidatus Roizmanbacteria bacterium]
MQRVDFFFFDMQSCQRCKETNRNLQNALDELVVKVKVVKHKLKSHEEYVDGFGKVISPSIFLNGKDIFSETNTSSCNECSDLCGKSVNCRAGCGESSQFTKKEIKKTISELLIS